MDQEGNDASKKKGGNESDQRDNAEQNEAQNENEAQIEDDQSWNQCMIEYESDDDSLNSAPSSVQGKTEEPVIPPPPVPHMEVSSSHVPLLGRLSRPPEPAVQDSANRESTPSLMGFTSRPLPVPGRIEPVPLQEGAVSSGVLVQTDSAPQTDSSAQTGLTLPDPMTPSVDMSRDESANVVSEGENQTIEVAANRDTSVAETITESMEDPLAAFSSPFVPPIPARPRPNSATTRPQSDTPESPTVQQDISSSENSSTTREFLLNLQKGIGPDLRNSFSAVGRNPMAVGTNQTPIGNVVTNPAVGADSNPLGTTGVNIGSMPAVNRSQNPLTPAPQAPQVAQQSPDSNDGTTRRRSFLQRLFSRKRKDGDSQGAAR